MSLDFLSMLVGAAFAATLAVFVLRQQAGRRLAEAVAAEQVLRAAAEARLGRLPELEGQVRLLQGELNESQKKLVETAANLQQEKRDAAEKLALIESAKTQLTDTFKALSSDALGANNQRFLTLAKEQFEKNNQAAKADLEKRQQAIGELLTPVKESLGKFDVQIKELETWSRWPAWWPTAILSNRPPSRMTTGGIAPTCWCGCRAAAPW
jgi:DNA recombination protein RmuC